MTALATLIETGRRKVTVTLLMMFVVWATSSLFTAFGLLEPQHWIDITEWTLSWGSGIFTLGNAAEHFAKRSRW